MFLSDRCCCGLNHLRFFSSCKSVKVVPEASTLLWCCFCVRVSAVGLNCSLLSCVLSLLHTGFLPVSQLSNCIILLKPKASMLLFIFLAEALMPPHNPFLGSSLIFSQWLLSLTSTHVSWWVRNFWSPQCECVSVILCSASPSNPPPEHRWSSVEDGGWDHNHLPNSVCCDLPAQVTDSRVGGSSLTSELVDPHSV